MKKIKLPELIIELNGNFDVVDVVNAPLLGSFKTHLDQVLKNGCYSSIGLR
jgi:hypothetical protein